MIKKLALFLCMLPSIPGFAFSCKKPQTIHQMPIVFDAKRIALTREYQRVHYGIRSASIAIRPAIIVLHWTGISSVKATHRVFNSPEFPVNSPRRKDLPGELNVSSHFLVDRDGTIYQLMPDNRMARHVIGLNHVAIGIENIGGLGDRDDLTDMQARANAFLICHLRQKYPEIRYVIGHNEYEKFRDTDLWLEKDPAYRTDKYDPGPRFRDRVLKLARR